MASNDEMKLEFEISGEVWKFFKKNYNCTNDTDEWIRIFREANDIQKKYDNDFCNSLVQCYIDELARRCMRNEERESR